MYSHYSNFIFNLNITVLKKIMGQKVQWILGQSLNMPEFVPMALMYICPSASTKLWKCYSIHAMTFTESQALVVIFPFLLYGPLSVWKFPVLSIALAQHFNKY